MPDLTPIRPPPHEPDPNLTVLPHISAPVDEGILIPYPRRSRWDRLLWLLLVLGAAGAVLAFAFLHANPMR